ncbi:MAG TPA: hypothetical protein VLW53_05090 [Candidatus Eisenbacteria bacterium]|nr:hypothetical protein [Candidatus Eisenbacteria bacterium]
MVTAVDVVEGSAKDEAGSLELVQEAGATTGLEVDEALADCAYGSGENRERFEESDITLLAKVPKLPRSIELSVFVGGRAGQGLGPDDGGTGPCDAAGRLA